MRNFRRAFCWVVLLSLSAFWIPAALALPSGYFVYFGTYTGFQYVHHSKPFGAGESHSQGIYVSRFNAETGKLSPPELAAPIVNPSFLAIRPDHHFLYAVTEDPLSVGPPLDHASFVSAFAIEPGTGKLRLLNTLPTGGTSTCFLSVDKTGSYVFLANFGDGSVSVLRIRKNGSLGEETAYIQDIGHSVNPSIQAGPHTHSILVSPDNRHVIVSDLGLDKVFIYNFDPATGKLSPLGAPFVPVPPGAGPRHFAFTPSGHFGYQLTEMGGIISAFAWDPAKGTLTHLQDEKTIPADFHGDNHSAEIAIRPDGRYLYESNRRTVQEFVRGPETIGVFSIDGSSGKLTEVEQVPSGGKMPRSFGIDPTGRWLLSANELSNNVVVFRIDQASGKLSPSGTSVRVETPVCVQFVPANL